MKKNPFNEDYRERSANEDEILRCLVGSRAYGTAIDSPPSDFDYKGIYISPEHEVIGITREQQTRRYSADDHNYSLRHFASLAAKCVPNVLELLFCEKDCVTLATPEGQRLRDASGIFLSKVCVNPYVGYAQGQLAKSAKVPTNRGIGRQQIVEEFGYDCYSDDTEFLTRRGWLKYDDIRDDDELGTIHSATHIFEFQRYFDRVKKEFNGSLIEYYSRYYNFNITPNHRMFACDMKRSKRGTDFDCYDQNWYLASHRDRPTEKYILVNCDRGQDNTVKYFETDHGTIDATTFFTLAGMFLSEGCVGKKLVDGSASVLRLSQKSTGKMMDDLRRIANDNKHVNIHYWDGRKDKDEIVTFVSDRILSKSIVEMFGEKKEKHIPFSYNWNPSDINALFLGMWLGDGSINGNALCYYSKIEKLIDGLQYLLCTNGYYTHKSQFPSARGIWYLHIDKEKKYASCKGTNMAEYDFSGDVVCFSVPNEILVTRKNGFVAFQGNTKFAMHTIRLLQTAEELLRDGVLRVKRPNRDFLLDVRFGKAFKGYDDFKSFATALIEKIRELEKITSLREKPDIQGINDLIIDIQKQYWKYQQEHEAWEILNTLP